MPEKSSEATPWIILGVGIVIGSVFAYFMVKAQQVASSSTSTTLPGGIYTLQQPAAQPSPPDTEFMKWYADKIIKPAIESTAKYAVKETLNSFHSAPAPIPSPMARAPAQTQTQALTAAPSPAAAAEAATAGTYKNNESWEFKRGPDGRLQAINVIRNAKTNPT